MIIARGLHMCYVLDKMWKEKKNEERMEDQGRQWMKCSGHSGDTHGFTKLKSGTEFLSLIKQVHITTNSFTKPKVFWQWHLPPQWERSPPDDLQSSPSQQLSLADDSWSLRSHSENSWKSHFQFKPVIWTIFQPLLSGRSAHVCGLVKEIAFIWTASSSES